MVESDQRGETDTHCLTRTGNTPLKFQGQLIARSRPARDEGKKAKDLPRWNEVALYRTKAGQWVVAISYCTEWRGEHGRHLAVVVPDLAAVVKTMQEYDPVAHLSGFPPGEHFEARQRRVEEDLRHQYAALVTEVLNREEFAEIIP